MTFSGTAPGLKTSICEDAPAASSAWGMVQCDCTVATPGTMERPLVGAPNTWSSDATTRPVRAATTVLTVDAFWTSVVTFSTSTESACKTIPW